MMIHATVQWRDAASLSSRDDDGDDDDADLKYSCTRENMANESPEFRPGAVYDYTVWVTSFQLVDNGRRSVNGDITEERWQFAVAAVTSRERR